MRRSKQQAYVGRKLRKRDLRRLWITRLSAACKQNGMNYSRFIHGLGKANVELDRKILSDLAIHDPQAFAVIAAKAKQFV